MKVMIYVVLADLAFFSIVGIVMLSWHLREIKRLAAWSRSISEDLTNAGEILHKADLLLARARRLNPDLVTESEAAPAPEASPEAVDLSAVELPRATVVLSRPNPGYEAFFRAWDRNPARALPRMRPGRSRKR